MVHVFRVFVVIAAAIVLVYLNHCSSLTNTAHRQHSTGNRKPHKLKNGQIIGVRNTRFTYRKHTEVNTRDARELSQTDTREQVKQTPIDTNTIVVRNFPIDKKDSTKEIDFNNVRSITTTGKVRTSQTNVNATSKSSRQLCKIPKVLKFDNEKQSEQSQKPIILISNDKMTTRKYHSREERSLFDQAASEIQRDKGKDKLIKLQDNVNRFHTQKTGALYKFIVPQTNHSTLEANKNPVVKENINHIFVLRKDNWLNRHKSYFKSSNALAYKVNSSKLNRSSAGTGTHSRDKREKTKGKISTHSNSLTTSVTHSLIISLVAQKSLEKEVLEEDVRIKIHRRKPRGISTYGKGCKDNPNKVLIKALFRKWTRIASSFSIPYVISYGSLLGYYRNGDVIPYDTDTDVLVDAREYEHLQSIANKRNFFDKDKHYHLVVQEDFQTRNQSQRVRKSCQGLKVDRHVDQCAFQDPMARLIHAGRHLDIFDYSRLKNVIHDPTIDKVYKVEELLPRRKCVYMGIETTCPYNSRKILTRQYGHGFQTPNFACIRGKWTRKH